MLPFWCQKCSAILVAAQAVYIQYLEKMGIHSQYIQKVMDAFTAQATIVTDAQQNQITCFHPGAMAQAHNNSIPALDQAPSLGIVSPDATLAMIHHVQRLHDLKIACIFDPGQMLPTFSKKDLAEILSKVDYVMMNAYEAEMLSQMMGSSMESLAKNLKAAVITDAEHGATLFTHGQKIHVPSIPAQAIVDPTGCGDAFRAGFIYGLLKNYDVKRATELAHVMGAKKIASQGGQNYQISAQVLEDGYAVANGAQV